MNEILPKTLFYQNGKMEAKCLETYMKFVLFYSLPKNDVNLQEKTKTLSQVDVQKLGVKVFFTTAVVHVEQKFGRFNHNSL